MPEAVDDLAPVFGGLVVLLPVGGDAGECFNRLGGVLIVAIRETFVDRDRVELIGQLESLGPGGEAGDRLVVFEGFDREWIGLFVAVFVVLFREGDAAFPQGLNSELRMQEIRKLKVDLTGQRGRDLFRLLHRPPPTLSVRGRRLPTSGHRVVDGVPFGIDRGSLAAAPAATPASVVHVVIVG